jgi:hypothetical protein
MGCGIDTEYLPDDPEAKEDSGMSVACGMGFSPEYSSRFLSFYVASSG